MVLSVLAFVAGCGDESTATRDGATATTDATDVVDATDVTDGAPRPPPGTPILERTPMATHQCTGPAVAVGQAAGVSMTWAVTPWQDGFAAARVSFESQGEEVVKQLSVSRPVFDPSELGDSFFSLTSDQQLHDVKLLETEHGLAIAWVEKTTPEETLRFAIIDDSGQSVLAPTTLGLATGRVTSVALAADGDTVHVFWADSQLRARSVGVDGSIGQVRVLLNNKTVTDVKASKRPGGWALVWQQRVPAGAYLALLSPSGTLAAVPITLTGESGASHPSAIGIGNELIVTWAEAVSGDVLDPDPTGNAVVRITKLDADSGAPIGAIERLQAVEQNILNDQPLLAEIDGQLALSWSRGTYVAICSGCKSDSKRHVLLLDPDTLVPRSNVSIIASSPGFSRVDQAARGNELALLLGIDFHASSALALAHVECTPF